MDVGAINVLSVSLTYFSKNENQKLKSNLDSDFCSRNEMRIYKMRLRPNVFCICQNFNQIIQLFFRMHYIHRNPKYLF
jgi:hypothetical protein